MILRFFRSRNPNLIVPRPWDDQNIEIWGVLLLFFRKISLYLCQYILDHPNLLYTLLYNIYRVFYTRINFPNTQKCEIYGISHIFTITFFTTDFKGLKCVPGVFWGFLRSRNPLAATPKFSEAQKCEFPYVLLPNCYIIISIVPETP